MKFSEAQMAGGLVFAAAMAAYLMTICPTVYNGDSGDFITASYTLGVAHPTGYPLYMLLGKAFSLIPAGSVAFRYNLMSAVFGALAAAIVCLIVRMLTKSWLSGVCAGLLVAFSESLWDQTTVAEVYALNGLFSALILWLILRWRQSRDGKDLCLAAAAVGFSLTNHMSTLLYLPAYAYLALADNRKAASKLGFGGIAAALVAPLALYLYLPLRAASNPAYNWGDPSTLKGFIDHVSGFVHRQAVVMSLSSAEFFERFFGLASQYVRQFSLSGVLVLGGLYRHGGKNRTLLNFTGLMVAADMVYAMFLNDVPLDVTTFLIPSIIVLGVWGGFGIQDLLKRIRQDSGEPNWQYAAVAVAVLVVFAANFGVDDKSQNVIAYDYGMNMLKTVDKGAVIFADGDNVVMPLNYLLLVEKARPDVTLIEQTGILSGGFYGKDYFYLPAEEHAKRQMEKEYEAMQGGRPVYYAGQIEWDTPGYGLVQTGLLYRVVADGETLPERDYWKNYSMRQIWNSTIYRDFMSMNIVSTYYLRLAQQYEGSDVDKASAVLANAVRLFPKDMVFRYELGNVLMSKGDYRGAIGEYTEAMRIDPANPRIHNTLGYAYTKVGDGQNAIKEYMTSLKLDPAYIKARNNLAVFLVNQSRYADAAEQYKAMITLNPGYAKAYFDLGRVYYTASKPKEAAAAWKAYLQAAPEDPNAQAIRAKIAELEGAGANASS